MDKDVVHEYNEILLSHLKKIPFAKTEMDLESIMLREVKQTKYCMIYHLK